MTRLPDWERRLSDLVVAAHRRPFAWGSHDCCLWAADAVQAVTGDDPAADLRGRYDNSRDAYRLLRELGGLRTVAARGGPPVAPLRAVAGDVGLVRETRPMLAVCQGGVWLCVATIGLHALPITAALMAWSVGNA